MRNTKYYIVLLFIIVTGLNSCKKEDGKLKLAVTLDRKAWTITADSETAPGLENTGLATAVLDGNKDTYWHTDYEQVVPYPHWLRIDMKETVKPVSVGIMNRYAATPNKVGMKLFKIEGSVDGSNWFSLGEFTFGITNDEQNFPVSSAKEIRYLKITALTPQATATYTFLAEVNVIALEK